MSEINISEQDRLHQLLCAYVLGEADAAERTEIEAALAKDPMLREERARLESTIGLVQNTLGKDETLSYQATHEVTRAAALLAHGPQGNVRSGPWYRSSSLRMAASIVAIVGGSFLGWRVFVAPQTADFRARTETRPGETVVARALAADAAGLNDSPRSLGYGGSGEAKSQFAEPAPTLAAASIPKSEEPVLADSSGGQRYGGALSKESEDALSARRAGLGSGKQDAEQGDLLAGLNEGALPGSSPAPQASGAVVGLSFLDLTAAAKPAEVPFVAGESGRPPGMRDEILLEHLEWDESNFPAVGVVVAGGAGGGDALAGLSAPPATAATPPARLALGQSAGLPGAGGPVAAPGEKSKDRSNVAAISQVKAAETHDAKKLSAEAAAGDASRGLAALGYLGADQLTDKSTTRGEFERLDELKRGDSDEYFLGTDVQRQQRRILTPQERQAYLEQVIASCRPLPNERPRDMFFRFWGDNPFEWAATDRLSTFSMDVDTASYTLARKYLVDGVLPEKAQIRTEEFVNYFAPDIAPPKSGTFAIATELAPGRFVDRPDKWMLRVAVRGQEVPVSERAPLCLTFVIDVSGSMKEEHRLELVKNALRMLMSQLDARDSVSIVAFSADTRLILPMTSAGKRALIESAIEPLQPDGGTNTEAGLRMGYEQALAALTKNSINRVVLLTDGVANVGITDPNVLVQQVERQRKAGIYLNTIGVGMDNHNDNLLEQLADKGDGLCNYVDDAAEVKHALVDNFLSTLVPIARDAKVQVEFDPAQVESYRLLGYENRAIADLDFRNDKVDAGEINSGHQITALYEIVRTGVANSDQPLAMVRVRYKPPHKDGIAGPASEEASEIAKPVLAREAAGRFEATSHGYRRAVLAAQFAEMLRRSVHARGDSLDALIADLRNLSNEGNDPQAGELSDMVLKSKLLLEAELARAPYLQARVDELRRHCYERERVRAMHRDSDSELLRKLDLQVAQLEQTLRDEMEARRVK